MQERRVVEHVIAQRVLQHRGCRYGGEQDARKGGGLQNGTTSSLRKAPRSTAPFASKSRLHTSPDPHDVPVARAVAASAAYPPVLSPLVMDISPARFSPSKKASLRTEPYRSRIVLMDGGVYDNLGLECAYKRCETLLVSDAANGARVAAHAIDESLVSCAPCSDDADIADRISQTQLATLECSDELPFAQGRYLRHHSALR